MTDGTVHYPIHVKTQNGDAGADVADAKRACGGTRFFVVSRIAGQIDGRRGYS